MSPTHREYRAHWPNGVVTVETGVSRPDVREKMHRVYAPLDVSKVRIEPVKPARAERRR